MQMPEATTLEFFLAGALIERIRLSSFLVTLTAAVLGIVQEAVVRSLAGWSVVQYSSLLDRFQDVLLGSFGAEEGFLTFT